jgi:hypothetical protein
MKKVKKATKIQLMEMNQVLYNINKNRNCRQIDLRNK